VASQKLTGRQIEYVLRRAADLEARREQQGIQEMQDEKLSVGDLVRLGEEAGLGSDAIMRALGELRRGVLRDEEKDALSRALGPSRLVVSREVPGPSTSVQRAVERFLREQLMTIRRHHGERIEWERAQGLWPGLARSLDFAKRYAFGPVSRVETVVIPEREDTTSVTFEIDLSEMRRHRLAHLALRAGAAFVLVGLGGAAIFPGFGVGDVLALFSGGAIAGSFAALERRRYQQARERVAIAPERFLDLLVQKRRRALDRMATPVLGEAQEQVDIEPETQPDVEDDDPTITDRTDRADRSEG
jgi:hypothetical protein